MNKQTVFVTIISIIVVGGMCTLLGTALTPVAEQAAATWKQEADVALTQAEANLKDAKAREIQARAEETQAEANLEAAKGELVLKQGQATALTTAADAAANTVATSNRLVTLWGISFPAMPPAYLLIGASFGALAAFPAGYAIGQRGTALRRKEETLPEARSIPQPNIVGA